MSFEIHLIMSENIIDMESTKKSTSEIWKGTDMEATAESSPIDLESFIINSFVILCIISSTIPASGNRI